MPDLTSANANRHAWALEKCGHLLPEALRKDTSAAAREVEKLPDGQIPAHIVSLILERADPTQNKGMTAWLVGQYAQGKLRLEDLGTANETLTMFRRYAPKLEPEKRDLGQYPNLAAVWEAVIGFANAEEQHISGKAQKALDRDKAYAESRILRQDPDGFTIAVPLTEFAAKWWGKGTRWCTSAEKGNAFLEYHQEAPLIVVVIPELKEKGKFQFWVTEHSVQFMNAADQSPPEDLVEEYWPRFEPIISFPLRQHGLALKCVPEALRTEEMCRLAVSQNGLALDYVPWDLRTEEICKISVTQNGRALRGVPWDLRTEDMCRIAVAQSGLALEHVSEDLRTDDMYRIALAQNGLALQHVPGDLRTDDMYRIALAHDGWALQFVPQKLRTDEMCRLAVAQDGMALKWVPDEIRTKELCIIAVEEYGAALEHVPWDLRTDELCRIAVGQDGWALEYVPEGLRTEDMCRTAVAQNGEVLYDVPQELRTEELCRIAVAQDGGALKHVPEALQSAMQQFVKQPQPTWDLAILDQWAEAMAPTIPLVASTR